MSSLFTLTVKKYEHIAFTEAAARNVQLVVWGICIGFFLASLFSLYQRFVIGAPIRALLRANALSPENAKTADELGFEQGSLYCRILAKSSALQRLVKKAEGDIDRYYVPEDLKYRAELRYEKKGTPIVQALLAALLSAAVGIVLLKLIPLALSMVDAIL